MGTDATGIEHEIRDAFAPVSGLSLDGLTVSDQCKADNNLPEGIRAPHALDAARAAVAIDAYQLDDAAMALVTASIDISGAYTMVLELTFPPLDPPEVRGAWRLYEAADPDNPTRSFGELLERYGLDAELPDGTETRFLTRLTAPGDGVRFRLDDAAGNRVQFHANAKPAGDDLVDWAWSYALHLDRYVADVARHRR